MHAHCFFVFKFGHDLTDLNAPLFWNFMLQCANLFGYRYLNTREKRHSRPFKFLVKMLKYWYLFTDLDAELAYIVRHGRKIMEKSAIFSNFLEFDNSHNYHDYLNKLYAREEKTSRFLPLLLRCSCHFIYLTAYQTIEFLPEG